MSELNAKLNQIQTHLNAPKDAWNEYSKYHYRSAESILQAVKPMLAESKLTLTLSDSIEAVGNRVYVKATATISDGSQIIQTTAYAREAETRKGMDDSQITGSASSYARKYALCGLFAIDDNKDADAAPRHEEPDRKGIDIKETTRALRQAANLDNLKAIFGHAWTAATKEQQPIIKDIYDHRKADFEAEQEAA